METGSGNFTGTLSYSVVDCIYRNDKKLMGHCVSLLIHIPSLPLPLPYPSTFHKTKGVKPIPQHFFSVPELVTWSPHALFLRALKNTEYKTLHPVLVLGKLIEQTSSFFHQKKLVRSTHCVLSFKLREESRDKSRKQLYVGDHCLPGKWVC